ncbi:dynamin family protein [Treponema sp. UBA6852]|uniref:dynamin family protein n=1 Tax=Treponema sp. UBA6852 TaxID=1947744 RepID=UPI0025EA1AC7|nr:dynamin family protein [Treponema sp. UBA6852]
MINIDLKYNAYTRETTFSDGSRNSDDFLLAHEGEELNLWIDSFLTNLIDTYNSELSLCFDGIERDCDIVEDAVRNYNQNTNSFKILYRRKVNRSNTNPSSKNKIEKLRELYAEMRSESCPFEELRTDKNIEKSFNTALDTEFEIAVVATMSSGKSTLINAMLGTELLPARNEATTATIARIHDEDDETIFRGIVYDKDDNEITSRESLTIENMNQFNDDPNTARIEIYGNIVGISSQSLKLVLTDTPGPNNSRTDEHKNHTYRLIKDSKYKPMVLYILDGGHLESNDDDTLLTDIANAMRDGGRQASDRFIFVINKADEFDTDNEDVQKYINKTKEYLEKHGIQNPKVFPCSSYVAKLIRLYQSGKQFTKKERLDLDSKIELFFDDEEENYKGLHFSKMADISESVRSKLEAEETMARSTNDKYTDALIQTGIPAVEGAISEYLEKYAKPQKITEAIHSFLQIIRDLGTEAHETQMLKDNKSKVEETQKAIDKMEQIIKKGDKGVKFKEKIDSISVEPKIKEAFETLSGDKLGTLISHARSKYCSEKLTENETRKRIKQIQADLEEFRNKFAIDIENIINEKVGNQARKYCDEYNSYVSELLGSAFGHEVKAASVLGSLATMNLSAENVEEFEFNVKEKTGTQLVEEERTRTEMRTKTRTRTRKKSGLGSAVARGFGKLFSFFGADTDDWGYEDYTYTEDVPVQVKYMATIERDKYENRQYVNFTKMFNAVVTPKLDDFSSQARTIATDVAKEEERKLKEAFKKSFDELNAAIETKLKELKNTLSDKKSFEEMVANNEANLAWLEKFKKQLNEAITD